MKTLPFLGRSVFHLQIVAFRRNQEADRIQKQHLGEQPSGSKSPHLNTSSKSNGDIGQAGTKETQGEAQWTTLVNRAGGRGHGANINKAQNQKSNRNHDLTVTAWGREIVVTRWSWWHWLSQERETDLTQTFCTNNIQIKELLQNPWFLCWYFKGFDPLFFMSYYSAVL